MLKQLSVPAYPAVPVPYTLPAIIHKSTITSNPSGALNDSLPIALHLDKTFPSPPLFPSGNASYALAVAVSNILHTFLEKSYLSFMADEVDILDERGREYFVRSRAEMLGMPSADVARRDDERVRAAVEETKRDMGVLVSMLKGRDGKIGVFFEGEKPGYADLLVVAFLAWFERVHRVLWTELMALGDGELRALWEACLPWLEGQGEEVAWEIPQ